MAKANPEGWDRPFEECLDDRNRIFPGLGRIARTV